MIHRSDDLGGLITTMKPYLPLEGFDPFLWLLNKDNVCVSDNEGNFGLFERVKPGLYDTHVFFVVKGKEAVKLSKEMLSFFFDNFPVNVLRGQTPLEKKGALWLARHMGFQDIGKTTTATGRQEQLWYITRDQFKRKINGK